MKHNIEKTLKTIITESANVIIETADGAFTSAEEKFLGLFDKQNTTQLGVLYSTSDEGVREFITRAGANLNLNAQVLLSLMRNNIVKIVPMGGYGRNVDYTLELQLDLNDIKGLAAKVGDDAEDGDTDAAADTGGSSSGGGFSGGGGMTTADLDTEPITGEDVPEVGGDGIATEEVPGDETATEEPVDELPDLETAGIMKYGDILKESAHIAKRIITEKKKSDKLEIKVYDNDSRLLNRLPKGYVYQLKRIIEMLVKKSNSITDKERIVADILDNLQVNFELEPKHVRKAYEFHRNQKRLQKYLNKK